MHPCSRRGAILRDLTGGSTHFTADPVELDGHVVLRLRGEIDLAVRDHVDAVLTGAVARGHGDVVLDIADLAFVDAHTLHLWQEIAGTLADRGAWLVLRNPRRFIRRLLHVCGVDAIARIEP